MKKNEDIQCCGTCKYHKYDRQSGEWVCVNDESECFGLETDYEDGCIDWSGKNGQ